MSNEFKFANLVQRANFNKWLAQYTHREEALIAAFVEMEKLRANNEILLKAVGAVSSLIDESHGVSGLHLNGDIAPWSELRAGGRFEEWLVDFDAACQLLDPPEKETKP